MLNPNYKHGMYKTVEHRTWRGIIDRCSNGDKNYGGRGITVCDEWLESFTTFYEDMGDRPAGRYSIERIDNEKGYCKENCKWAGYEEQGNNKRNNHNITYNGLTQSLSRWSRGTGIKLATLHKRLKQGWSVERALTTEVRRVSV